MLGRKAFFGDRTPSMLMPKEDAELTVIIVNWNTRELTLKAIGTLLENAGDVSMHVVVWDNASTDGSADAIASRFPEVELVRHHENVGFAAAHNMLVPSIESEWLLLLNSDTETHPRAIENLLAFSKQHPEAGITGGQTTFPDGSLNPTSCWNKMTVWSLFCSAIGLTRAFRNSPFFNPEGMGNWQRDTVRHVDIVTGCLFMLRKQTWNELGGFLPKYFMYGEEFDMCLRAAKLGYTPMITPDARVMHLGGASARAREDKIFQQARSRASFIKDHWSAFTIPIGLGLMLIWSWMRMMGSRVKSALGSKGDSEASVWKVIWRRRSEWIRGY